ncbi:hypothetical protein CEXT_397981 [Caerostris extrusa]|uniref:Uncharacterized protein n=1 Tax=Caerostris extrusa TaxID=172846 RepID=A0AAV4XTB4_CAEEX|nr:hypothetical protein CEXT_397981 [Caerostris extrusa]
MRVKSVQMVTRYTAPLRPLPRGIQAVASPVCRRGYNIQLYQAVACVRFSWTNQWLADTDCYFFAHIDLAPFSLEKRE